jgi:hypothetical protein
MEDEVQRDHDPANTDPISVAKKHLYRSLPEFVVYFLVFALLRARYGGLVSRTS